MKYFNSSICKTLPMKDVIIKQLLKKAVINIGVKSRNILLFKSYLKMVKDFRQMFIFVDRL